MDGRKVDELIRYISGWMNGRKREERKREKKEESKKEESMDR